MDLKEGTYIRWIADRMFKAWDTFGIVIKVDGDSIIILTFDDNKETEINLKGEAISSGEITIVDKLDFKVHLQNDILKHQIKINELNVKIEKLNNILNTIK